MKRLPILASLGLAAALVALVFLWLSEAGPEGGEPGGKSVAVAAEESDSTVVELESDSESPIPPPEVAPARAEVERGSGGRFAASHDGELAEACWVEGRVVPPQGMPAGEPLFVVADGRSFRHGPLHRVAPDPDGRFRVAFHPNSLTGRLRIESRFAFLDREPRVRPREEQVEPILLEPRLGGALVGKLVPPAGSPELAAALGGARVSLLGSEMEPETLGQLLGYLFYLERSELDAELGYRFDGIPPEGFYQLSLEHELLPLQESEVFQVRPGEVIERDLALSSGARISGRVVDESGDPLGGIQVWSVLSPGDERDSPRVATSADGAFRFDGLPPAQVELRIREDGWLPVDHALGPLGPGDQVDGLELVLRRGPRISGLVLWPDGSPAAGMTIEVEPPSLDLEEIIEQGGVEERSLYVAADDQGRFTVGHLRTGPYVLRALTAGPNSSKPGERGRAAFPRAELEDIYVGAEEVVLELGGQRLEGRVTDDLGQPIPRYKILVERSQDVWQGAYKQRGSTESFRNEDGSFALVGLSTGEWTLSFSVAGHEPQVRTVRIPAPPGGLSLVLPRAATIRGVVVDSAGEPVQGARVFALTTEEQSSTLSVEAQPPALGAIDQSNRDGEFTLHSRRTGEIRVWCTGEDHAYSEPVRLRLQPGEEYIDLRLVLDPAGKLLGRAFGVDGRPAPRHLLEIHLLQGSGERRTVTGGEGEIRPVPLAPGLYELRLRPRPEELVRIGALGEEALIQGEDGAYPELDPELIEAHTIVQQVRIVSGAETRVVLGEQRP